MTQLAAVDMRLELKKGINNTSVINDSYSNDPGSLEIALSFLEHQVFNDKKTVILSDMTDQAMPDEPLYNMIMDSLEKHRVTRLIAIGERISSAAGKFTTNTGIEAERYPSTAAFIQQFKSSRFNNETILVKGARIFAFEQIVRLLEQKVHQTVLELDLNAITHNLNQFQQRLRPGTKIMAMVKAFAYGSGGAEIAGKLQYHKIDYLGVAYADEGVELRDAGIMLPVMVMNPEPGAFDSIVEYALEPEIFSFGMLQAFDTYLKNQGIENYPVHIEMETGMNRLGFATGEIEQLAQKLSSANVHVKSVFTHLAGSEDPSLDEFTFRQHHDFTSAASKLEELLGYKIEKHIANSAAVIRYPQLQMDMVRLGIGLYGVNNTGSKDIDLIPVATLRSTVAQVKHIRAGESVSYNRKSIMKKDSVIATVRVGYADGYPRRLGNGIGKVWINGALAPVTGTVCMDMLMLDVTGTGEVHEGDEVVIFGKELPVEQVAEWAGTIPYEMLTGISQRVRRIYFEE
jgi:alanine racemase